MKGLWRENREGGREEGQEVEERWRVIKGPHEVEMKGWRVNEGEYMGEGRRIGVG